MKIKVSEATNIQLDWMVTTAEGWEYDNIENATRDDRSKKYSTNWSQGGPIIEREFIELTVMPCGQAKSHIPFDTWLASKARPDQDMVEASGPTPLIAAMRCYVASKLGDEVEVPEELK